MMMISERASVLSVRKSKTQERSPESGMFERSAGTSAPADEAAIETMLPPSGNPEQGVDSNSVGVKAEAIHTLAIYRVWIEPANSPMKSWNGCKRQELVGESTIIGRRSIGQRTLADLPVRQDPPYTISRQHCEITNCDGQVVLTDLGSYYGTHVNGMPLGRACGAPESIRLSAGKHFVALGPPDCGNYFHVTVSECGFQEGDIEDMPT